MKESNGITSNGVGEEKTSMKGAEVVIYTSPTCIHCKSAKEFFNAHNIHYTEYDVIANPGRRQEAVEKSGQMGVPVILVDGELVIGFDEDRLRELLGV